MVESARYASTWAALEFWLCWTAPALLLKNCNTAFMRLLKTRGRYVLSGLQCPPQTGHNDCEHRKTRSLGYFKQVNSDQHNGIWVCPSLYCDVGYGTDKKRTQAKILKLEEVVVKRKSVFVEHDYTHYVGVACNRGAALCYHVCTKAEGAISNEVYQLFMVLPLDEYQRNWNGNLSTFIMMMSSHQAQMLKGSERPGTFM